MEAHRPLTNRQEKSAAQRWFFIYLTKLWKYKSKNPQKLQDHTTKAEDPQNWSH